MGHGVSGRDSKYAEPARGGGAEIDTMPLSAQMALEFQQMFSAWANSAMTRAEREALANYAGIEYKDINHAAKYGTNDPRLQEKINALQQVLLRSTIPTDMTSYRGVTRSISAADARKMIGKTITEGRFVSTSLDFRQAYEYSSDSGGKRTIYQFSLPKGLHGAYIDGSYGLPGERETLLPSKARFRITGVKTIHYSHYGDPEEEITVIQATYLGVGK